MNKAPRVRPKAQRRISNKSSIGKSLLSKKESSSGSGESAAVHLAQSSLSDFGDKIILGDNDPAVGRTVEILTVAGIDGPAQRQEKEARSIGGIRSQ
ncbi:MAG: hypothetical protein KAR03_12430 [Candidatus Thorarchaeota archaeon]|nr:hypothetical protein [Candidatus Thorarchaeota archaeon]